MRPPSKKGAKRPTNSTTSSGACRSTPTEATQKLVETRLRKVGMWDKAVKFHDDLDLLEIEDPDFAKRRERIRMHLKEDGTIKLRADGTMCEFSALEPALPVPRGWMSV